ncbi:uncharacterized protein LOC114942314 [Nylanderia fulva]|uniref:uncharacterized protein LOC114942314 n=1 Tax=Nylanderia fulva TaxID=613905 RepID=UPI0010FAE876|nr:uncharacterized protein LOC114942314 [Nylanderia fulva]
MSGAEDSPWFKERMSKIVENLGSNVEEARYELSKSVEGFMSTLYYVCVKFKDKTKGGQSEKLTMIIKRPTQIEMFREMIDVNPQFHNEIVFYQIYARPDENFVKCFYADERPPIDSVIALENVNQRGYYSCPYKNDVSLEYTLAAIQELGRFHGKGYVMKEQQREKFFDIVKQLQETKYKPGMDDARKTYVNIPATRAVEYLRDQGHDAIFCDKMEAVLSNAFDLIMVEMVKPTEPLATLCHGDFTVLNTLFKTEDDGEIRAMLIDFGTLGYSTPVVDLSTFLYLCCTNELRKDKLFEIIRVYHETVKKYLLDAGVQDIDKYSYDAFLDDFRKGALFGFVIASFFLPGLLGYLDNLPEEVDMLEHINYCKEAGGDEISKILADMLLQLRDFGFLKHVL